jgi:hypothetical protein
MKADISTMSSSGTVRKREDREAMGKVKAGLL